MNISPRIQQIFQDNATPAFSPIGNKSYYLFEDVVELILLQDNILHV